MEPREPETNELLGAVRSLSAQVGGLQSELHALRAQVRPLPDAPDAPGWDESTPARRESSPWVRSLDRPGPRGPAVPRLLIEIVFLVAVALAAAIAELDPVVIVLLMAGCLGAGRGRRVDRGSLCASAMRSYWRRHLPARARTSRRTPRGSAHLSSARSSTPATAPKARTPGCLRRPTTTSNYARATRRRSGREADRRHGVRRVRVRSRCASLARSSPRRTRPLRGRCSTSGTR